MGNQNKHKHYVYIVECKDGTYYTGYTNDLQKRIQMHQEGKGAKYTRGRTPVTLIFFDEYDSKTEALKEEYRIKQLSKAQKKKYIISKTSAKQAEIEEK